MKAVKEFIIVQVLAPGEKKKGGIILPASAEEPPRCHVVSVGEEVKGVQVGDTVICERVVNFQVDDEMYGRAHITWVLAVTDYAKPSPTKH